MAQIFGPSADTIARVFLVALFVVPLAVVGYALAIARSPWLQECPKPLTKEVWGNSLGVAPADARLGLADGDTAGINVGGHEILVPVRVSSLHAEGVAGLALGHGRTDAGVIGTDVGGNAYRLRSPSAPWRIDDATIRKASGRPAYSTQKRFVIDGDRDDIFPSYAIGHLPEPKDEKPKPNLLRKPDQAPAFGAGRW